MHRERERQRERHAHRHRHAGNRADQGTDDDAAKEGEDGLYRQDDFKSGLEGFPDHGSGEPGL